MSRALQKLGRYQIDREIARGGMAIVYHGELIGAAGFRRDVAIKKILPHWTHEPDFINMLIDEAKILVELHHHNIVQIFELAQEQDCYFLVMEYVPGLDLKKIIQAHNATNKKLPIPHILGMAKQICAALHFAHTRIDHTGQVTPIIHRDVSPQNILIRPDGIVKITDFGIAKVRGKSHNTRTGTLKGKFPYMSPEQAIGTAVDPRTDIFAFGAVLFEMITGKKCFDGGNDFEILEKIKNHPICFPEDLDSGLSVILKKCLNKSIHDRFQTAEEIITAIEAYCQKHKLITDAQHFSNYLHELEFLHNMPARPLPLPPFEIGHETHSRMQTKVLVQSEDNLTELATEILITPQTTILDATLVEPPQKPGASLQVQPAPQDFSRQSTLELSLWTGLCALLSLIAFFLFNLHWHSQTSPTFAQTLNALMTPHRDVANSTDFKIDLAKSSRNIPDTRNSSPLSQHRAKLRIKTTPADTNITLTHDKTKKQIDTDKNYAFDLKHDNMEFEIEISKEGFKTERITVNFDHNTLKHNREIKLTPVGYGAITVNARPWGTAKISASNESKTVPALFAKIPEGPRTVSVYYPPTRKYVSRTITVTDGSQINCRASFSNKNQFMVCR